MLSQFVDWSASLRSLWDCDWAQNLSHELFTEIIVQNVGEIDLSTRSSEQLLCLAISSLQAFVQDNFVGPVLSDDVAFKEITWHSEVQRIGDAAIRNYLMSDGEEINVNVSHPELLAVAKYILLHLQSRLETVADPIENFICQHWLLRYYGVHQLVIDENTDTLFKGIEQMSQCLIDSINDIDGIDKESKVICLLEITSWQLHYKRVFTAKEKLQMAQQMLDVTISIEGKMGVRTKYQQKPLPQLMLRVDSPNGDVVDLPSIESPVAPVKLPALLQLDDDVRLERIRFVNEEDNLITRTKSIVQTLILATL